jgi:hypothetical protein
MYKGKMYKGKFGKLLSLVMVSLKFSTELSSSIFGIIIAGI